MKSRVVFLTATLCSALAYGDTYTSLVRRFEIQIQRQERQLGSLRGRLQEKARDAERWKSRAEQAKTAWTQASAVLEQTRAQAKNVHEKRTQVGIQADAAQWKTTENILISRSATMQSRILYQDLYARALLNQSGAQDPETSRVEEIVLPRVAELSSSSQKMAEQSEKEEAALRGNEMRLQNEEAARSEEADHLREKQEAQWLKWQEALRRKAALEDEISEIDQSAKALQVMLQELRDHRDQARALSENRPAEDHALASLRGSLPWPAHGRVVQGFGRQYPDGLNQLVVSNGIKIDAGASHTVRVIQEGKVIYANAFRQYGQLVIVQHKNGLTSVYAGLGQTQVKEGQMLAALDQIGITGDSGSFYFELRRNEEPVNPLVYLTPAPSPQLSLRREFR